MIRKRQGEPKVPPPLVREVAAQAAFPPAKSRHIRLPRWANRPAAQAQIPPT